MKTLTIRLTSPLQSYGNEASFGRRTTGDYPSKSAVVGMIAAAMGYGRDDHRIFDLNDLKFAVRIDQPGKVLTDFHTVEWKKDTRKITHRDYLQDAVFVVAIGSDDTVIDEIKLALKRPHYPIFLGRRSNVPAGLLHLEEFPDDTPVSVLKKMDWQASQWYQRRLRKEETVSVEMISDANLLPETRNALVRDRVVSFDQRNRQHGFRAVATIHVDVKNPHFQVKKADTQHDIMNFL